MRSMLAKTDVPMVGGIAACEATPSEIADWLEERTFSD
jgi:hypothetical protein